MSASPHGQFSDFTPGDPAFMRSVVTESERLEIPQVLRGCYVWFGTKGQPAAVRFGDGEVSVDAGTDSALEGETLTAQGTEPHLRLSAGQWVRARIPKVATHLAHVSPATSGKLFIVCATNHGE